MTDLYAQDGVNVHEGDSFSAAAARVCRESATNSNYVEVHDLSQGHFRGPRGFTLRNLPDGCYLDLAPDGIGTKVIIVDAASAHRRASQDLMAMCCGDITRWGGLPLLFTNVLDVSTLGKGSEDATSNQRMTNDAFRDMILGLGDVAKDQGIVVYKGETAELGQCVGSENPDALTKFNWAGVAFGVYHPDKMITGDSLAAGQVVMALREHGFRSNGISSVRKALALKFGPNWYQNPDAAWVITAAVTPSVLYDRLLAHLNGWHQGLRIKMHLIVHVTGGAFRSKLGEDILFPRNLSADLDDLWTPPEIMCQCAQWRGMTDEDCYETWHGGQGVLVVIDEGDVDRFIRRAHEFGIEAKACGKITNTGHPTVTIRSKFNDRPIIFKK